MVQEVMMYAPRVKLYCEVHEACLPKLVKHRPVADGQQGPPAAVVESRGERGISLSWGLHLPEPAAMWGFAAARQPVAEMHEMQATRTETLLQRLRSCSFGWHVWSPAGKGGGSDVGCRNGAFVVAFVNCQAASTARRRQG